jgi:hypothetical protein
MHFLRAPRRSIAVHANTVAARASRRGGPTLSGHAPPDSQGESPRGLSRPRLWVAASLQNAPVSLLGVCGAIWGLRARLCPPTFTLKCSPERALNVCLPQSPKGKVQRRAAKTGEKPVVIGFAWAGCGIPLAAPALGTLSRAAQAVFSGRGKAAGSALGQHRSAISPSGGGCVGNA